jgi:hypothetical protein
MANTDAPHGFDAHAPIYELFEYTQDVGDGTATTGANYYGSKNDHIVTHAGNASTKISGMELDVTDQATVGGFSVLGLFPQVGNASGETHSDYFVVCNEHLLNKEDGSGI